MRSYCRAMQCAMHGKYIWCICMCPRACWCVCYYTSVSYACAWSTSNKSTYIRKFTVLITNCNTAKNYYSKLYQCFSAGILAHTQAVRVYHHTRAANSLFLCCWYRLRIPPPPSNLPSICATWTMHMQSIHIQFWQRADTHNWQMTPEAIAMWWAHLWQLKGEAFLWERDEVTTTTTAMSKYT